MAAVVLLIAVGAFAGILPTQQVDEGGREGLVVFASLMCAPFFCSYAVEIYLSDLFVMALTALLFWALKKEQWMCSLVLLFLMQMARESTVVITAVLVVVSLLRRKWLMAAGAVAVMAGAMVTVGFVSRESPGNIHAMGGLAYMVTKVLSNGLANVLGVTVWADTYARTLPWYYPDPPLWQMDVPKWLPLGSMKALGIYTVNGWRPVETLMTLASTFGVLTVVLWRELSAGCSGGRWRAGLVWLKQCPLVVVVAFLTGGIFFLLAPFSGRSLLRLTGYAWPLFWLAVPQLSEARVWGRKSFWGLHLACMWWPVLLVRMQISRGVVCGLGMVGVAGCLFAASRILTQGKIRHFEHMEFK